MKIRVSIIIMAMILTIFVACTRENNELLDNSTESNSREPTQSSQVSISEEAVDAYMRFLSGPADGLFIESYYALKDLDDDGIPELIIRDFNIDITVYTYGGSVTVVYNEKWYTASTRLLYSDNPSYPGIFTFHVGGGHERYGYLVIKDGIMVQERLWDYNYSGYTDDGVDTGMAYDIYYTGDMQIIEESRAIYENDKDIEFLPIQISITSEHYSWK